MFWGNDYYFAVIYIIRFSLYVHQSYCIMALSIHLLILQNIWHISVWSISFLVPWDVYWFWRHDSEFQGHWVHKDQMHFSVENSEGFFSYVHISSWNLVQSRGSETSPGLGQVPVGPPSWIWGALSTKSQHHIRHENFQDYTTIRLVLVTHWSTVQQDAI